MTVALAALLSAAMFYLSQGLDNVWALAWFAPVPLLWLAYGKAPTWQVVLASLIALLAGDIYALQCYSAIPAVILLEVVGPQVVLFPLAIVFARITQRNSAALATLFAFPVCWTACEFLSEIAAPNGTFGSLAYSQVSAPILIQSASLFGLYAITFLICLFANACAMSLRARRENAVAVGVAVAICAANVVFGFARLAQPQRETVRVAALVDESAMVRAWHARSLPEAVAVAQAYASAIRRLAGKGAQFAVTPEGGIVATAGLRSAILAPLVAVSKQTGTQIIAGVYQSRPPADLAFSILPDAAVQQYDKRHLVPILENMFTPGHKSGWLGQGRGMEICKDMDFPGTIRRDAAKGVRLMGVPAGDFGKDAWLHARMAVMRGVEDGFSLVRAANDGLVTASDAEGRLVASKMDTPSGLTAIIADLPLGPGPTLYARIGDAFPWLCVALLLLLSALALFSKKLKSDPAPRAKKAALG
jgi:apolipoprotein N-acyltransferase